MESNVLWIMTASSICKLTASPHEEDTKCGGRLGTLAVKTQSVQKQHHSKAYTALQKCELTAFVKYVHLSLIVLVYSFEVLSVGTHDQSCTTTYS